ncbi:MAG: molybdopterin-guanine dinucleotide biosynthesis protein A [Planctomyces sp.]|nr:molybdopterin-guanine dinucleotide biosynthesis protein A [Planctomyces sp.]
MQLAGIVLAGGESRRMGEPKAWLPFGRPGGTMLTEVVATVRKVCEPVVVVAAPEQSLPELPDDVQILRDPVPGQGPLAALVTGLSALPEHVDAVFLCSCDVPLLSAEFITGLAEHMRSNDDFVVPRDRDIRHPLAALYRPTVISVAHELLSHGTRSLQKMLDQLSGREISGDDLRQLDPDGVNLLNVNLPEDHQRALELYQR